MSEILYLKLEKNIRTYSRTLTLGEAAQMRCADPKIVSRLKAEKLYTFDHARPGRTGMRGPYSALCPGCD